VGCVNVFGAVGCATAAHFGEASAGLVAGSVGAASLARWAPFDGIHNIFFAYV